MIFKSSSKPNLALEIAIILIIKLILIYFIWDIYFRPHHQEMATPDMASHLIDQPLQQEETP